MASSSDVRAGGAWVEFYAKGQAAVQKAIEGVGATLKKIGFQTALVSTMLGGMAAGITSPFIHGLSVASEWGKDIVASARMAGMGFEQTQSLAFALRIEMGALGAATGHMDSFLNQAANGSGEAAQALSQLGLTFQELNGITNDERIRRFAEALNSVADAAQRGALQRQIFGRSALGMDLSGGAAGIQQREQHGREIGAVMNTADLGRVAQYNAVLRDMNVAIQALWASVGQAALTPMMEFFEIVTNVAGAVRRWVNENRASLETVFRVADAVATGAVAFTALAGAIYGTGVAARFFAPTISIATAALGAVWSVARFAATGFGALSVASWAWGLATSAASAIAAGAVWAWSAAVAAAYTIASLAQAAWGIATAVVFGIATAATWAWSVASTAALAVYKGAVALATVATTIYALATGQLSVAQLANAAFAWLAAAGTIALKIAALAATVATLILSGALWEAAAATTIATAGLNVLAAALAVVTAAAVLAGVGIGAAFAIAPVIVAAGIAFTGLAFAAADTASAIVHAIAGAVDQASSAFARLGESGWRTLSALGNAFTELYGTARQAFAGIYDAMRAGDFQLAWEIVQTAGLLAWEKIKTRGLEIFTSVSDFIEDAMREAFAAIQSLWVRLKAELIAGALEVGAVMLTALNPGSATIEERARLMMLHAADLRAGNAGPTSEGWRDAQARIDEEREQAQREAERNRLNRAREAALERGDQSEADRLQLRLNALVSQAAVAAGQHDFERARRGGLPGEPGAGEIQGNGLKLSGGPTGTFMGDAQAASRMFGGGDVGRQQLEVARNQLEVERQQLEELRRREAGEAPAAAAPAAPEAPEPVIDRDPGGFRNRRDLLAPGGGDEDTVPNAGGSPLTRILGIEPPEAPDEAEPNAGGGRLSRILGVEPPDMGDEFADAMQVMEASFSGFADRIAASLPAPGELAPMPGIGSDGNGGAAEGVVSSDIGGALLAEMRQQTGAIQQQTRDMIAALDRAGGLEVS